MAVVMFPCLSASVSVAAADNTTSSGDPSSTSPAHWLKAIWGTTPADGGYYLPVGFHNDSRGPKNFALLGGIYKTVFGMTFINSYGDRTWALGIERDVCRFQRLTLAYGGGLMYGYGGRLVDAHSLPLRDTFLFEHAINPVIGAPVRVDISKHVQIEGFITPVVMLVGFKIRFD